MNKPGVKKFTRRTALGTLSSLPLAAQQAPKLIGEPPGRIAPREDLADVLEFEDVAQRKLAPVVYATIAGGDRAALERITLRPRMMVPTTNLDLHLELLGQNLFAPILAGPVARQQQFHPDGELATARGASAAKTLVIVSEDSSVTLEKIAAEIKGPWWYQVYPRPDLKPVRARVDQAISMGAQAICIAAGALQKNAMVDPALSWGAIEQLRTPRAPVVLKGIMSVPEASQAVKAGVGGILVSNYGGLGTLGMISPIEALPAIVDAVGGKIPVLADGGFRRGSDIFKALALGASAVVVARPVMWGLAAYGANGVQSVLEMLQTELGRSMAGCGKPNLASLDRSVVKVHQG